VIAAFGPVWAAFELGVVPRTLAGLIVLALLAPTFIALVVAIDMALRWSGRQEVLGSLEFSPLRLAIAMTAGLGVMAALLVLGIWLARSSPTASGVKRFVSENFRWGV
jgi:hypothetical protein